MQPIPIINTTTLWLEREGDALRLDLDVPSDDAKIIELREQASVCQTHDTVLAFLKIIKNDDEKKEIITSYYHTNYRKYRGHAGKGCNHKCNIDNMIAFVETKIHEKHSPHLVFNKVGKALGYTFLFLSNASKYPLIGTVAGAIKILIGVTQIIVGLALSILFAIPAIFSENAQIICQRSAKHIGYGLLNIFIGAIEGTPIVGTLIHYGLNP